jgi:cytochrome c556
LSKKSEAQIPVIHRIKELLTPAERARSKQSAFVSSVPFNLRSYAMKRLMCVMFGLSLVALSGPAIRLARSDDEKTPTIKEVMQKLHKGPNAALAKLKKNLAADTPDWADIQARTKDFETYGEALPKNDPPKGEKEDFKKLADSYYENAKKLNASAKKEDKDGVQASFKKISNACAACHKAHRPS